MKKRRLYAKVDPLSFLYSSEANDEELLGASGQNELSFATTSADNTYVNPNPEPPPIVAVHSAAADRVGLDTFAGALAGVASGGGIPAAMATNGAALGGSALILSLNNNCTGSNCHNF